MVLNDKPNLAVAVPEWKFRLMLLAMAVLFLYQMRKDIAKMRRDLTRVAEIAVVESDEHATPDHLKRKMERLRGSEVDDEDGEE